MFLFESLPEELLFRGFIFSHLNTRIKKWKSALFTIGLFVLLPVGIQFFQKNIFGLDVNFGGNSSIAVSYLITMLFFGAFVQYLRILTNSIWTGVGFHLLFVYMNQLMGVDSNRLIQFTELTSEAPMQITFISALGLIFITLLIYPRITKRKIGWNKLQTM